VCSFRDEVSGKPNDYRKSKHDFKAQIQIFKGTPFFESEAPYPSVEVAWCQAAD